MVIIIVVKACADFQRVCVDLSGIDAMLIWVFGRKSSACLIGDLGSVKIESEYVCTLVGFYERIDLLTASANMHDMKMKNCKM